MIFFMLDYHNEGLLTCSRCGRQEYGVLSELKEKGWTGVLFTPLYKSCGSEETCDLCPACTSLVDSVIKSTLAGKSVNIPAVKDYQY